LIETAEGVVLSVNLIGSHSPFRLIEAAEDVVFTIKGFTEDPSCLTLKAV